MPSDDSTSGLQSWKAYVLRHGGFRPEKSEPGLGANRCDMCSTQTDHFLEDFCEGCARYNHAYDEGESEGIASVLIAVVSAVQGPAVSSRLQTPRRLARAMWDTVCPALCPTGGVHRSRLGAGCSGESEEPTPVLTAGV